MRSESEMFNLILKFAREDERIRAVYMNGSRANPKVPKDIFQDYDIVYVVTETLDFIDNQEWIQFFGDLIMMQEPDRNHFGDVSQIDIQSSYGFLMLFEDGNRIDLRIQTIAETLTTYGKDSLTVPLLDKDNLLPKIHPPSDRDYFVQKPTQLEYDSYTNNFWWCLQNVAKGMWRNQLPYSKLMFEHTIRKALDQMIAWWIGIQYDFRVSVGMFNKYFKDFLPENYWKMYEQTYANSNAEHMWESIFVSCELFRSLAQEVAERFQFTYPMDDDRNMTAFLKQVKDLPKDAKGIN